MSFNLSPSVDWAEQDYSLVAVTKADTIGGLPGTFLWGPVNLPTLITGGEDDLADQFHTPSDECYISFMIAKDFLGYSKKMWIVRGVGAAARNAVPTGETAIVCNNTDDFEADITGWHDLPVIGRFPGALANDLALVVADKAAWDAGWAYKNLFEFAPEAGEYNVALVDTVGKLAGTGGVKQSVEVQIVHQNAGTTFPIALTFGAATANVSSDDSEAVIVSAFLGAVDAISGQSAVVKDGTTDTVVITYDDIGEKPTVNAVSDRLDGVVVNTTTDQGNHGSALEIYSQLSNDKSARKPSGANAFYGAAINGQSKYVRVGTNTPANLASGVTVLQGGVDDNGTLASPLNVYDQIQDLENSEALDVQFLISGAALVQNQQDVSDVVASRRDCFGFYSPPLAAVLNNRKKEVADILDWRKNDWNKASSYDVIDGNWGLMYDQYNEVNRWVPCCGGTAGLTARTWFTDAPWASPAFHNRGRYKNYSRLAWSPRKGDRDELYKAQVNPVINMPGEGRLLYGDKTGTPKDSAFNRINVRGMFIVVEKTIANLAKYYLGEVNDEFTRTQFLNVLNPYLRSVKTRRGMEDYRVVCDERNNDAQARASNEMRADIWIKPLYSINFIKLNFAAVRPDISFDELEGQLLG